MSLPQFFGRSPSELTAESILIAAALGAATFVVLVLLRRVFVSRLGVVAARTTNKIDDLVVDLIARTKTIVLLLVGVHVATRWLPLPEIADRRIAKVAELVLLVQVAIWGNAAVNFWIEHYLRRQGAATERLGIAMARAVSVTLKILLWLLIALGALLVLEINIAPLLAGISVGGIAIALAVQNILADLFAALAIIFDKPFDVGDTIAVDQITGTVEHIGLKTTRLRSVSGEQVVIGNGDLLKSRLRNYKRMYQRRMLFNLDVRFDTPAELLEGIPGMVRSIVEAQTPVRFDRSHVSAFTDSAIRIESVYFVLDPDYQRYMDIHQAISLEIVRAFRNAGIEFALPARRIVTEAAH